MLIEIFAIACDEMYWIKQVGKFILKVQSKKKARNCAPDLHITKNPDFSLLSL